MSVRPVPGPRSRRSDDMIRRLRLLNTRYVRNKVAAEPTLAVVDDSAKKTDYGRVFDFFALFLGESSIHGLNHLVAKRRAFIEHFIWALVVISAVFGSVWLSLDIWKRYNESPTAISMERNFMDWSTALPSGTICLDEKVDEAKLQTYVDSLKEYEDKEKLKEFLRNLANATYDNFREMTDIPNNPVKSDKYLHAIMQIYKDISYQHYSSATSPDPGIVTSMTEKGICSTYNTKVAIYNNPEYWVQNNWSVIETTKNLTLHGHPVSGPIYGNMASIRENGLMFYYHSPYDVLDASYNGYHVSENVIKIVVVGAMTTYTTAQARTLSTQQRKCRFPDENYLRISPVYTFNFCRMECRMTIARERCDCIPHFYRSTGEAKICDVQGMRCLGNYSELLTKLVDPATGKKYPCKCLPECDQVVYYLAKQTGGPYNLMNNGMSVQYGIEHFPRMRLKRDVIFGFSDLWVSIGGTGGLFLGCSVLSIIEIFYFFTIRLLIYILGICRKRRGQRLRQKQKHPHERILYM